MSYTFQRSQLTECSSLKSVNTPYHCIPTHSYTIYHGSVYQQSSNINITFFRFQDNTSATSWSMKIWLVIWVPAGSSMSRYGEGIYLVRGLHFADRLWDPLSHLFNGHCGHFPKELSGKGVSLTAHLPLVPRSRIVDFIDCILCVCNI